VLEALTVVQALKAISCSMLPGAAATCRCSLSSAAAAAAAAVLLLLLLT
jgi:hypothetical protein